MSLARKPLGVEAVIEATALYYTYSIEDIRGSSRTAGVTHARHIAMYLARYLVRTVSYVEIGEKCGRDHSTVIKAIEGVQDKARHNAEAALEIQDAAAFVQNTLRAKGRGEKPDPVTCIECDGQLAMVAAATPRKYDRRTVLECIQCGKNHIYEEKLTAIAQRGSGLKRPAA
jgi:hypothetical protein